MTTQSKHDDRLMVSDLSVSRGDNLLIDNLSFSARDGDLIWITGSNGVGKTSLLKCLAGLLRPDSGQIDWNTDNPDRTKPNIAFHGHNDCHKPTLTVIENLEFWQSIYESEIEIESLLERLDISGLQDLQAKNLSAGQSRRVALARLLLKNAKVWLLDEPAAPMDKAGRDLIADLISQHLAHQGIAIIASHKAPNRIGKNTRHMILSGAAHA